MQNEELIKACRNGERAAQKRLYDAYAPQMMGVCYRYAQSLQEAEDILQEAFIRVFSNLDQFRSEGEPGAWIRRIVVNCAINAIRKRKMQISSWDNQPEELHPITNTDPEIKLDAKELADLIQKLPDGYRIVFNLHAVEGYTHEEIGKVLGIKPASSRSQYLRARALLAKQVNLLQQKSK
jgi:RNA polymerase sigma-70 factor (ECF subfamily)